MPMGKGSRSGHCAEGLSLQEGAPAAPRVVAAGTDHDPCGGEEKEKRVPGGEFNV